MFSTNSTHSANAYLYNNLGYDPLADFTPLALLVARAACDGGARRCAVSAFRDFIAAAKGTPDTLNFGFGNTGSLAGGAMLNSYAGIKTAAVSYRGTPQATTDLLGGQIEFVVMDVSQTQEHIKAGKLRTLAVTGQTRMEIFPKAPTMIELGFPDFVLYSWNGVHGPPGMPAEIVATLNTAIRDAIKTPEGKRFYDALGAEIGTMSAKEFGDFVAQELKRWEKIIALTGCRSSSAGLGRQKFSQDRHTPLRSPPPLAGRGWGGGRAICACLATPTPTLRCARVDPPRKGRATDRARCTAPAQNDQTPRLYCPCIRILVTLFGSTLRMMWLRLMSLPG
jgi:tripartite-type tricarboxylate transporter receptor subunit TctC